MLDLKPKILSIDPWLRPYEADIALRMDNYREKLSSLLAPGQTLGSFANGHLFYGFHKTGEGWIYREWAPAAEQLFLIGDFNGWNETSHPMTPIGNGNFEIFLPEGVLEPGMKVLVNVISGGKVLPPDQALTMAYRAIQEGAHGVDMGRNIFQAEDPKAMAQAVAKVVHENYTDKMAYEFFLDTKK